MKNFLICVVAAIGLACSSLSQSQTIDETPVALVNVSIIDTVSGAIRPGMTVVIARGRIATVAPNRRAHIPKGASRVDASGKFLIPGLWDMHVHLFFGERYPGGVEVMLPLFIANGITGVRDMGSDLAPILAARRDTNDGSVLGPRMVIAGPMLDGPTTRYTGAVFAVASPAGARDAVTLLRRSGVDFIKVQSVLSHESYLAIADACRAQGMTLAGHVPDAVSAAEAITAGQKSFEHLLGVFEASSSAAPGTRKKRTELIETFDPAREAALIRELARNQVWQVPTLYWGRGSILADVVDMNKDPDIIYAPLSWRTRWAQITGNMVKDIEPGSLPQREKLVEHTLGVVKRMHDGGVPFLAGTDTPAAIDVIPGSSLHHELERFVAAGFSPLEALQTATINPAKFLGTTKDFGTVEKGKIADLVLLDANPLADIRNTRSIDSVIANGRLYSKAAIRKMLADVQALAPAR